MPDVLKSLVGVVDLGIDTMSGFFLSMDLA